jgi:hypothetical protein
VIVLSLVLLMVVGYFPARLLTGARFASVVAAPITGALLLTLCGIACLIFRLPVIVALVLTGTLSAGCAFGVLRRGARHASGRADSPTVLLLPLGGLIPFATVLRAPVAWDARSIWWFHAKWWAEGGTALMDALRNPAFNFSHSDYPPLVPATIGGMWSILGSRSLKEAQVVSAVLTLSATATLGVAFWRLFSNRLPVALVTGTGCLLVAACYGIARVDPGTNGYADFLWAAAFAAAAVFLLASPRSDEALRWGVLTLAVAAVTKNEALVASLVLGALAAGRYRFRLRPVSWIAVGLAPGVLWLLLMRVFGVFSDVVGGSRTAELLRLDPSVTKRISPTLHSVGHEIALVAAAAAVVTAIGMRCAQAARRDVSGSLIPWMWFAWAGTVASLILAYVVSGTDLHWYLVSSVRRTTIAPNFLLLAESAIWTLTLVLAWRNSSAVEPAPRRDTAVPAYVRPPF